MPGDPDQAGGYLDPYRDAVDSGGPSFEALLWRNREFQLARFRVLIEAAAAGLSPLWKEVTAGALASKVIADLGCGRADLLTWLRTQRVLFGRYIGVEAIPEFAEASRAITSAADSLVVEADFADDPDLFAALVRSHGTEVFLFSGSLNTFEQADAQRVIERAFRAVEHLPAGAVVFNFLSSLSPNAGTDNTGPAKRFDTHELTAFAASLSPAFMLRHDYLRGHDATIGVFSAAGR